MPEVKHLFEESDILLFTETWTSEYEEAELQVENFDFIPLHRTELHPRAKRSSGGLLIYLRSSLRNVLTFIQSSCDDILWMKLNGAYFGLQKQIYICLSYVLPAGSSRESLIDIDTFDRIQDNIIEIKLSEETENISFMLLGDLNARTACDPDYVLNEEKSDFLPLPEDYVNDISLPVRLSADKNVVNDNVRKLLDLCKATGLRIANCRCGQGSW